MNGNISVIDGVALGSKRPVLGRHPERREHQLPDVGELFRQTVINDFEQLLLTSPHCPHFRVIEKQVIIFQLLNIFLVSSFRTNGILSPCAET